MVENEVDILVTGGGLAGLSLCAALIGSGFRTAVIDRQGPPTMDPVQPPHRDAHRLLSGMSPRFITVGNSTHQFLDRIGVWSRIPDNAISSFSAIEVFDGEGTGSISFKAEDAGVDQLGFVIENGRVVNALFEQISEFERVSDCGESALHWNMDIDSIEKSNSGYLVRANGSGVEPGGYQWQTNLLVGADGSESRVRRLDNFHTVKWKYDHKAVVTTIETTLPHESTARQWFTDQGILALLPLQDDHLCSIVYACRDTDTFLSMDEKQFCKQLEQLSEGVLGPVLGIDERLSFPLSQQHSLKYTTPHLTLIGDAAHTVHPLAGQGANIGIADAKVLAQVIRQAHLEGRMPGDIRLLRKYQRMRQPDNLLTAAVMEAFARGYDTSHPAVSWLRNNSMKLVNRSDFLKSIIVKLATER